MFRRRALDTLSGPEPLDEPLRLGRPGHASLLASLLLFSGFLVLWSVFGLLPVRIQGRGVLIRPGSLRPVQTLQAGRVVRLLATAGQCLSRGSVLVVLDPVQLRIRRDGLARELLQLRQQHRVEDGLARQLRATLERDLQGLQPFRTSGAIAEQTFVAKQVSLDQLIAQQQADNHRRVQQITTSDETLRALEREIIETSQVRSPINGCVVDRAVQVGQVVEGGQKLMEMDISERRNSLESLVFFPAADGKRIRPGQMVRVTPATTTVQRHGGITGRVLSVQRLPVSREALLDRLGNAALVNFVSQADTESIPPLIEVRTSLNRDPLSLSGYDWGGGAGPALKPTEGTPTQVRVHVEGRQPISYVIPLMRNLSGIY